MKVLKLLWKYFLFFLHTIRCIPHLVMFYISKNKPIIKVDMKRAFDLMDGEMKSPRGLLYLLTFRQFRNLFYFRIGPFSTLLNIVCPELSSLHIHARRIGEGLAIIHGVATEIGAESIGKNCTIFQQVTIGGTIHGAPTIMDNVTIYAAAVVVGKITIGNNVVIGANATVCTNVPDNCTVLPGSSKVMRWNKRD